MIPPPDSQTRKNQFMGNSQQWLFAAVVTLGLTFILSFNLVAPSDIAVEVGQPAANDVFAPRSVIFTSEILTNQAREQAQATVQDEYTPFDLSIGLTQLGKAQAVFSFIEVVRADVQATTETKLRYLQAIEGLTIEEQVGLDLLVLNSADYLAAKGDVLEIIDIFMRRDIRESQLSDVRRAARREASLELTPTQNNVVTSLAPQFIVATVFLDEETTAQKREEIAQGIEPITRSISKDQRIIQAGDMVTEAQVEVLTALGLLQNQIGWKDVVSMFLAALFFVVLILLYWQQFYRRVRKSGRYLAALATLLLLFVALAKIMVPPLSPLAYLYPIAAMSMLLAVIFDIRTALFMTILVAALAGYIAPNSLELVIYISAGGLMSILTLHDAVRINAFFRAGLIASVGHLVAILIFHLPQNNDLLAMAQLLAYAIANGIISSALTMVGFFIMGSLFGVTTTLQLQELSRLDHPLLQELLRRAPGTYHHSIMVANLAEQAAERIRANSTLVRVGAFYHDIGKMNRPPFFAENQEGVNPHDKLDPYSSARIIISHVSDGLELARRYRLPDRIQEFIAEHHGDRILKSFYVKAKEQSSENGEQVDVERFRHKGPRPRTRESGIVMLADATEATSSAIRPNTEKGIEKLVNSLIDEHLTEGQLDDSNLTMGDIGLIRASFIETLKGRFHVRVKYPGNENLLVEGEPGSPPAVYPLTPVPERQPVVGNQS